MLVCLLCCRLQADKILGTTADSIELRKVDIIPPPVQVNLQKLFCKLFFQREIIT